MSRTATSPLPLLLLTTSPLLREEVKRVLALPPSGGGLQLHICEPREPSYAPVMAAARPQVALIALDDRLGRDLLPSRELQLVLQLVQDWRVPTVVLGLQDGGDPLAAADAERACRAVGAVDYLPRDRWSRDGGATLRAKLAAAARVKVVRPLHEQGGTILPDSDSEARRDLPLLPRRPPRMLDPNESVVVIGASAGGPDALREFLRALPPLLPAPLLIIQHIPPAFGPALATDLSRLTNYQVRVAARGDDLVAGQVLLAPGRQILSIVAGRVTALHEADIGGVHGQAIDRTMESVANCYGSRTVGVILSGMGEDGVQGLRAIKARGGVTFGQDEASSHVYGMPRRAAELGLVDYAAAPTAIGAAIGRLFGLSALVGGGLAVVADRLGLPAATLEVEEQAPQPGDTARVT